MYAFWKLRKLYKDDLSRILFVCLFWIIGIATGYLLAGDRLTEYYAVSPADLLGDIPFVWNLLVNTIPILILLLCMQRRLFSAVVLLMFLRAFFCGFTYVFISQYLGNCAWLIRPLFLLSSSCVSILMLYMVFRYIFDRLYIDIRSAAPYCLITLFISLVNVLLISPFLANFVQYF